MNVIDQRWDLGTGEIVLRIRTIYPLSRECYDTIEKLTAQMVIAASRLKEQVKES